ncbi:MAG: TIGR04211 family SH3 domain-containing protein [Gammaproteobacteria bacterium]|nr:TIGR04211 family SH3 domain-containing protein [Gammaproteobacteria bacterium]MCP5136166.1 TIGR04211 family SH3 domain-containing protein [Gammaproteobacteria bacterium]
MIRFLHGVLFIVASLMPALAGAVGQTAYVSDELVIGVYPKASLSGEPIDLLKSGAPLEILQRNKDAAQVRLPNGETGWIESAYLSADKPNNVRVLALQDDNSRLKAELESLQAQMDVTQAQLAKMREHIPPDAVEASYEDPRLLRLMEENMAMKKRLLTAADALGVIDVPDQAVQNDGTVPLLWLLVAIGVTLLVGFVFGLLWLDRSIRRRHGGFRI